MGCRHILYCGNSAVLKIHILFDFAGRVLQAVSQDNGKSFLSAKYFFPGSFNKQGIVKIISASQNSNGIEVTYTYGYETNYGKLVPSLADDIKNIEKPTEITEIKPEIEQFAPDNAKTTPPEQYKQENDTDMLFKMIKALNERIDALESCLNDNRQINIVQESGM